MPITVCVVTALTLCLLTVSCLLLVFRTNLQVWLHSHYNFRLSAPPQPTKSIYDAFVGYSVQVGSPFFILYKILSNVLSFIDL